MTGIAARVIDGQVAVTAQMSYRIVSKSTAPILATSQPANRRRRLGGMNIYYERVA
jgi:hypothetical protein